MQEKQELLQVFYWIPLVDREGLPDGYARGRIIGDYRRVALYGINKLIEEKKKDKEQLVGEMNEELIRLREEVQEQIKALESTKVMAKVNF
jgi:formate C-acetyltransferase